MRNTLIAVALAAYSAGAAAQTGGTQAPADDLDTLLSGAQRAQPSDARPPDAAAADSGAQHKQPDQAAPSPSPSQPASPPAEAVAPDLKTIPVTPAAPPSTAPSHSAIEEIVVTARRVAENQQDVPVAISAMNAADLQREQINSPQDLQGRVPSLVIGTGSQMRNTETPTIRGQGAQYGASPGVVIYYGEVPLPSDPVANNQGGPGKFFDLANVQVLKGSQGTLFGRNTTGGAMLLVPQKPEETFSATLKTSGSTLAGINYEGVLNTPLVDRDLLLRVGAQYFDRGGFTTDVKTGKDYDNKHYWTSRFGLTWRPNERVENYLLGYYTDSSDNGTGFVIQKINRQGLNQSIPAALGLGVLSRIPGLDLTQTLNLGCLLLDIFGPSSNCGQDILAEQNARGPRHVQLSADPDDVIKTDAVVDNFSYSLADDLTLRNIASYSAFKHHYRWDQDGSRATFNDFDNPDSLNEADLHTYTEELQLQGSGEKTGLQYAIGGYYEYTASAGAISAKDLFIEDVTQQYQQSKRSFAPFAQGTYSLGSLYEPLDGLSATLGARYTSDKTSGSALLLEKALGLITTAEVNHVAEVKDSAPTYTFGLDYKFGTNLVYGKLSRGYKTGGISVAVVNPAHYTYKPEYVTNYEIGQKSDFEIGGIPARVNTAVYYTSYTGLQKDAPDSYVPPHSVSPFPELGDAIFNVGRAWVGGFEFEGTIQPVPLLTLVSTYGYTRAAYSQFSVLYEGATPQLDCSGKQMYSGSMLQLSCVPFQSTPTSQFSLSARVAAPIDPSKGTILGSVTYAWTDKQYSAQMTLPQDEPGAWLPSYGLLGASVIWSKVFGSTFDVQLYGTNLTNKLYRVSNSNQWHLTYFQSSVYSEPRIVGLTLAYGWD
ncbi:MAG: TonB-dependent receptor [Nevskia sp.]|nr:TonB-dependent receptor [Nevskia sp.]